jgi:hypothetical protein
MLQMFAEFIAAGIVLQRDLDLLAEDSRSVIRVVPSYRATACKYQ